MKSRKCDFAFLASESFDIALTPCCVLSRALALKPRASRAFCALCFAIEATSCRLDETSSRLDACSDDFVFDNQMLAQSAWFGFRIGEISCPTKYFEEASSINFRRSVIYGLGVLKTSLTFRLAKMGLISPALFQK